MTRNYGTPVNSQFEIIHVLLNQAVQQLSKTKGATEKDQKAITGSIGKILGVRTRIFDRGSGITGRKFGEKTRHNL